MYIEKGFGDRLIEIRSNYNKRLNRAIELSGGIFFMKNKFLIGDMAKIHNVSTQTLRYYDKLGLLKPKIVDENNGYRYYTIDQFEQLNTIKYLKFLGMCLSDIKEHFEKRDIKNIVKLLEKQNSLTRKKIKE